MSERVRIVVLVDATGSMGAFCSSVGSTLKQLFAISDVLFDGMADVDIVSYEDYCDPAHRLLRVCEGANKGRAELKAFAAKLRAGGGGDPPEAVKTALNHIVEMVRTRASSDRTVVIHYTDAPPHHRHPKVGSLKDNLAKEKAALRGKEPGFDWVSICLAFRQLGAPVITFMSQDLRRDLSVRFMAMLGDVVAMPDTTPETITRCTMCVLLQLMGQPSETVQRMAFVQPLVMQSLGDENSQAFVAQLDSDVQRHSAHRFEVLPAFARDLKSLTAHFQESESFRDMVFRSLEELLVPECVLAITYNGVLGLLWRLVCRRREDSRVQPLCDALSLCCSSLQGASQVQLRAWIDQSYNQIEEVREIVSTVEDPLVKGALVLDSGKVGDWPTKDELRSILHAPTPGVLRKVQALLTRLIVVRSGELPVKEEDDEHNPMYLPLALSDKAIFSLLSHLLLPGMMSSLRPAAMFAILAHLSGNAVLQPRAKSFLESIRGQWIPPAEKAEDYPEILNGEFVRLVVRVPEFLTESERVLYQHLSLILRVRRAEKLRLPVQTGYTPVLRELTADFKLTCGSCGQQRSRTLMKDGTCGLCLSYPPGESHPEPAEHLSHMAECRACKALYAVVRVDRLNVTPKCHFCRHNQSCESVTCTACGNKLCAPAERGELADGFTCAVCAADPAKGVQEHQVTLAELAEANPDLVRCLGLPEQARKHLFDHIGLYKLWLGHGSELQPVEASRLQSLRFAGKPVLNVAAIFDAIVEQVLHGRLSETCNLCFEERPLGLLQSACGLCTNLACQDCLRRWYGQLQPGQLYVPCEGLCAFCKRTPKVQTLRPFNRLACRLAGRRSLELRADMYYGWCKTCFRIAEAVPRECAAEAPKLREFECEACKAARLLQSEDSLLKLSKTCPGCSAPTVKISGCNHITCPCGVHWCWQCRWMDETCNIYDHMETEHGTIGFDDGENSDFSDEEYY